MIDQDAVIRFAQSYRDTWLDSGEPDELGAIVDAVRQYTATLPAVFVAGTPTPGFAEARTTAAKALNAGVWTNAHAVDAGVLFEKGIKTFATSPEYLVTPLNAYTYLCFYNAAWIMNTTEEKYTEMTTKAATELAKWNKAANGDPFQFVKLQLAEKDRNRLSYSLDALTLSESQKSVRQLLAKLNK